MITIVFGKPGAGKTAFLAADVVRYINGSPASCELLQECAAEVRKLNDNGALFSMPTSAPVYTNFPVTASCGTYAPYEPYYVDGFHLGFENDDVEVMPVLPCARIYLSEAQRYYNSRRSKDLPDWVSRYFEEHRHFGLQIYLDVQRPGLIDVNIRELCERFLEIQRMEHRYDRVGNIVSSTFFYREFTDWKYVDQYLGGHDGGYTEGKSVYTGNIFECYESKSYFRQFVPERDFAMYRHVRGADTQEDAYLAKVMYQQTPPEGFYAPRRQSQSKQQKGGTVDVRGY